MRRPLRPFAAALAALAVLGGAASVALADGSATASTALSTPTSPVAPATPTTTSHTTSTSSTTTTTAAPAAKPSVHLYLFDSYFVRKLAVNVPGRTFHVTGVVSPYVAGQQVGVAVTLGTRRIRTDTLKVKPSRNGRIGVFTEKVTAPRAGVVRVRVVHVATPQLAGFDVTRGVTVVSTSPGVPLFTALVQSRLAALHFYLPQSGKWDLQTALAIDAYHRLLGKGTSQSLDPATLTALLDGQGAFHVRYPGDGQHVEGDLGDQLLALINGSKVYAIYPISSGKPSTPTILGRFRVYERTPGYLPDGMYYSDFFFGGYAIHGYDPAPDYPASHGCMRLPISDAISVFDWLNYGVRVDVYQ